LLTNHVQDKLCQRYIPHHRRFGSIHSLIRSCVLRQDPWQNHACKLGRRKARWSTQELLIKHWTTMVSMTIGCKCPTFKPIRDTSTC
jgi:hypothetical protein